MNEVCMLTHSMTPNQISAASGPTTGRQDLLRDRRDHRQDDEGDLEEVEEERQEEDEQVDEDQEAPDAAGQGGQHDVPARTPPETPRNTTEKQVEPIRMNTTIVVMRMVVS